MSLNIRTWLEAGGFGQYADLFEANEIDGEALLALTGEHLKELGIPLSRRAKLLKAIAGLSPGSSPSPAAGPGRSPGVRTAGTAPDATATPERRHLTVMFVDLGMSRSLLNLAERDGRASYPQFTAARGYRQSGPRETIDPEPIVALAC